MIRFPRRCRPGRTWILAWLALVWLCATAQAADKFEVEYRSDVVYGTGGGENLVLDAAVPQGVQGPLPGLIFIHGGGWQGGAKEHFAALAKDAAAAGYASVTVGYRLAPRHPFPAQVEDCKCAVRWMRAHAEELQLDPDHIGAFGGSAGGHLAMMLGALDPADGLEGEGGWGEQPSKVQAVVSIVGPTNLIGEFSPTSREILKKFLGGTVDEKREEYRRASPITYVTAGDAPMLLFQGTKDPLVPYDQAFQMTSVLDQANVPGRIELLVGAGHGWQGKEMERTIQAAMAFFDEHLRPQTVPAP